MSVKYSSLIKTSFWCVNIRIFSELNSIHLHTVNYEYFYDFSQPRLFIQSKSHSTRLLSNGSIEENGNVKN